MNEQDRLPGGAEQPRESPRKGPAAAVADVERRRLLLKSLGKGSALVVAATPIRSLASNPSVTTPGNNTPRPQAGLVCTISGVGSAVHSQSTGLSGCGGLTPGYYQNNINRWPGYNSLTGKCTLNVNGTAYNQYAKFNVVFGGGSTSTLWKIISVPPHNSAEFHWIAALLNSIWYETAHSVPGQSGLIYPYTSTELVSLYNNNNAAAYAFITGYLENY